MSINRHNYEMFFLLYADNELSASEREEVVLFVQQHPDLAIELDAILQTKLIPDSETLLFPNKHSLYKQTVNNEITAQTAEEQFLLYVDNELSESEKNAVETFVLQHPDFQEAFIALKQTKLPEEYIECPDKNALYQSERKQRPVIYLSLRVASIAAVVIGILALGYLVTQDGGTVNNNGWVSKTNNQPIRKEVNKINSTNNTENTDTTVTLINNSSTSTAKSANQKLPSYETIDQTKDVQTDNEQIIAKTINQTAETNTTETSVAAAERTQESTQIEASESSNSEQNIAAKESISATEMKVVPVSYKILNTSEEDKSLYVGALEINKDKIRGFLRKAGGIFKSKIKTEDENLQVSSFSINTKSLK